MGPIGRSAELAATSYQQVFDALLDALEPISSNEQSAIFGGQRYPRVSVRQIT